ncbi:MAG: glycosyltransferase, partial [Planctomycetota bacterium]
MRVLMLTTDLRFSGAERVIIELMRWLRDHGVACAACGLTEGGQVRGRMRALLEGEGFEVHSVRIEEGGAIRRLARMRDFVLRWRPDLFHCHMFHGNAAGLLLRLSGVARPMVWTHHVVERRRLPLRAALRRLASPVPECHVSVSDAVRRYQVAVGGPGRRHEVVHNGIELGPFLAVEPQAGAVFGAVGRLDRQKGFDLLVRAFARLSRENGQAALRIAGEGPERPALLALARSEGVVDRLRLCGFVEDVPAFLSE